MANALHSENEIDVSVPFAAAAVIAHRPFRALWLAQVASQLALNTLVFVLALDLYQRTGSNTAVSGLYLCYGIPAVLLGMVAGVIVDRLDRKLVLIVCDASRAVLTLLLLLLGAHLWAVYGFVLVSSIINQFYVPAEGPTIPRIVPTSLLVTANSLFTFTYYSSMALGFIMAGPMLRVLGLAPSLILLAGLFLFAALSLRALPSQGRGSTTMARISRHSLGYLVSRVVTGLTEGIAYVRSLPKLWDALLLLTGTQIMLAILGTLGPGFADRVLSIDIRDASLIIIGPVVLGLISGAIWVGNVGYKMNTKKLVGVGILGAGTVLMLVSITIRLSRISMLWSSVPSLVFGIVVLLFFLLGVCNSFLDVPSNTTLQASSAGPMRGRVYGLLAALVGGVGVLPVIVGGVLADLIGVGKVIFALGSLILLYGIARIWLAARLVRRIAV